MMILLATVGISFAAFAVWLTVRIINRRERWAKWTIAGVIVMVYPFCAGHLLWLAQCRFLPDGYVYLTSRPFKVLADSDDGRTQIFWPPRHEGGIVLLTIAIMALPQAFACVHVGAKSIKRRRTPRRAIALMILAIVAYTAAVAGVIFIFAAIESGGTTQKSPVVWVVWVMVTW